MVNAILKNGETFDLNWRRLQSQTQDLKAKVIYPYLFGLPVGVDYSIKLYKKDTTFIDVNNTLGFNYYYSGLNHVKAFYKQHCKCLVRSWKFHTQTKTLTKSPTNFLIAIQIHLRAVQKLPNIGKHTVRIEIELTNNVPESAVLDRANQRGVARGQRVTDQKQKVARLGVVDDNEAEVQTRQLLEVEAEVEELAVLDKVADQVAEHGDEKRGDLGGELRLL